MGYWNPVDVRIPAAYGYFVFTNNQRVERTLQALEVITRHSPDFLTWKDSGNLTSLHYLMAHGPALLAVIQFLLDHGTPTDELGVNDISVTTILFQRAQNSGAEDDPSLQFGDEEISSSIRQLLDNLTPDRQSGC